MRKTRFERKNSPSIWELYYEQKGAAIIAAIIATAIALNMTAPAIAMRILGTKGIWAGAIVTFLLMNIWLAAARKRVIESEGVKNDTRAQIIAMEIVCLIITTGITLVNYTAMSR